MEYFNKENLIIAVAISIILTLLVSGPSIGAFLSNFAFAYVGTMIGQKIGAKP